MKISLFWKCYSSVCNVISRYHWILFFKNDNGNTEEINAERYADMLVTFDLPGFNEQDPDEKTLDKFD